MSNELAQSYGLVLVAEDDVEMRGLVADDLTRGGFDVLTVGNGNELANYLWGAGEPNNRIPFPDLVVTDVRLPGPSGLDVLAALRSFDLPVTSIVITAFGDRVVHEHATRVGAFAVLDKPFDLQALRVMALRAVNADRRPRRLRRSPPRQRRHCASARRARARSSRGGARGLASSRGWATSLRHLDGSERRRRILIAAGPP